VQQSFHLHDNLTEVAEALESHPLIDYEDKNLNLPFEQLVNENWARFAGSSVWLPDYGVYLAVTRVIYVPSGISGPPSALFEVKFLMKNGTIWKITPLVGTVIILLSLQSSRYRPYGRKGALGSALKTLALF